MYPHPSFTEVFNRVLAEHGYPQHTDRLFSGDYNLFYEAMERFGNGRLMSISREESMSFWYLYYDLLMERLGISGIEHLKPVLYETFSDPANYRPYDDVVPALRRLRGCGYRLAILSNWEEWLGECLEDLELTQYFDTVVISGVVKIEKPNPAIFHMVLEGLGTSPQQTIHLGDSYAYDAQPALDLGMVPVIIDRRGRMSQVDLPCFRGIDEFVAAFLDGGANVG